MGQGRAWERELSAFCAPQLRGLLPSQMAEALPPSPTPMETLRQRREARRRRGRGGVHWQERETSLGKTQSRETGETTGHIREERGFEWAVPELLNLNSQRLGQVQSFGCILLVEEKSFEIRGTQHGRIPKMLGSQLVSLGVRQWEDAIGMDVRALFKATSVQT